MQGQEATAAAVIKSLLLTLLFLLRQQRHIRGIITTPYLLNAQSTVLFIVFQLYDVLSFDSRPTVQ